MDQNYGEVRPGEGSQEAGDNRASEKSCTFQCCGTQVHSSWSAEGQRV